MEEEELPQAIVPSPFGLLTVESSGYDYPNSLDLDVACPEPLELDGAKFDGFHTTFTLTEEGELQGGGVSLYPYRRGAPTSSTLRKLRGQLEKALLASKLDLLGLEMAVIEQLEAKLRERKQDLEERGVRPSPSPPPAAPAQPSALGELLGSTLGL